MAVLSVSLWLLVEGATHSPTHTRFAEMVAAARTVQAASRALWTEKQARGLLPPAQADPNRTGMIGREYSAITTTLGDVASKRTTTNPDLAAALVGVIGTLDLSAGTPVVIVVSGSFVGANVAAIAAVEALGLRPVVIVSLSASMWGANDPEFNWLEMAALLRAQGVIRARAIATVLGGDGAVGGGIDPTALAAMRAAAARDGVPVVIERPLAALVNLLLDLVSASLGDAQRPGAVINVGGALIGLGNCRESYTIPPGLTTQPISCTAGTPGIAIRLAATGVPVLHVLNIRRLALELDLPFDPIPLPVVGDNERIYGSRQHGVI